MYGIKEVHSCLQVTIYILHVCKGVGWVGGWVGALIEHALTSMSNGIIWNKQIYLMSGCLSCSVLISYNNE